MSPTVRTRRRSLGARILTWSFVPTAVVLAAVAFVVYFAYQQVTEDLVLGRNREVTRLSAVQLSVELTEYTDFLTALARGSDVYRGSAEERRTALQRSRNRLTAFDGGVVILDNYGRVVASDPDRPMILGQNWSSRDYFRQILHSTGPVFSDVLPDGPEGSDVVVVAVPITSESGDFVGAAVGMFRLKATSLSSFYGSIVKLRVGGNGYSYLVDSRGRVVYHSDTQEIGESFLGQPAVQEVLAGRGGSIRTRNVSGDDIVASFASVPGTPWGLVSEEDWGSLTSSSQPYGQFLLALILVGLVAPAIVVAVGVQRITTPVTQLTEAAREVAAGNFDRVIHVESGDEIEDLANQFNLMTARLRESYAELERRVADRTRELATLNSIASVTSGSLHLDEVLQDALEHTLAATELDAGWAYQVDNEDGKLALIASRGLGEGMIARTTEVTIETEVGRRALAGGKPFSVSLPEYPESRWKQLLLDEGIAVLVLIPLMAKGRVVGIMNLAARGERDVRDEDLSLLAAIGQQVGIAVLNAQLYESAEEHAAVAERNRLARDLHDAVTQTLFSASLIAEVLPNLWDRKPEEARRRLGELRQMTRGALAEMRTLLLELRPAALAETQLPDLLRQICEATTGRARIPVALSVQGECQAPSDVKIMLYRIAQEALNNVAKHSGAGEASVTLTCGVDRVRLEVKDDGRGFDPALIGKGRLGLGIMRERAEAVGARAGIISRPGEGTVVFAEWNPPRAREKPEERELASPAPVERT